MFRIFVLIGFTYLFLHLHATGDISKYINMKYAYISESAIYIFVLFTIICVYNYVKRINIHMMHRVIIVDMIIPMKKIAGGNVDLRL